MKKKDNVIELGKKTNKELGLEEALGIWAMYSATGRAPDDITLEELQAIGNKKTRVQDVTSLVNGLMFRERKLIESLIDDNAIKDIILQDKLGVTKEDYEKAKETRAKDLADFETQMQAEIAKAKIELASAKDKEYNDGE